MHSVNFASPMCLAYVSCKVDPIFVLLRPFGLNQSTDQQLWNICWPLCESNDEDAIWLPCESNNCDAIWGSEDDEARSLLSSSVLFVSGLFSCEFVLPFLSNVCVLGFVFLAEVSMSRRAGWRLAGQRRLSPSSEVEVNHELPSSSESGRRHRRTRTIDDRRLGPCDATGGVSKRVLASYCVWLCVRFVHLLS